MAESGKVLEVKDLATYFFTDRGVAKAVNGVSFALRRGKTLGLVGESGCGKSVTALSIMRLVASPPGRIVRGEVLLDGVDLLKIPEDEMRSVRGNRIAMVFQEPMTSLNPVFTVGNQIMEAWRVHNKGSKAEARARALEMLKVVRMPDPEQRLGAYPHELSGGLQQRVMIAMALINNPSILIADEPTTALDVTIQAQILALIADIQQRFDMAVLFITHDLAVIAETADDVAVMYGGRIVETADVKTLFRRPLHPYTRLLFRSMPRPEEHHARLQTISGERAQSARVSRRLQVWHALPALRRRVRPGGSGAGGVRGRAFRGVPRGARGRGKDEMSADGRVVEVSGLKKYFPVKRGVFGRTAGWVRAVDGVSFTIERGKTLGLVGESGCGKTTTGRAILRLIEPTEGRIIINGQDVRALAGERLRRARRHFQIIFQDPYASLNPRMTVQTIVEEGLKVHGIGTREERRRKVATLLERVGLPSDAADRYPHEFSGGQRQRIGIARALALEPVFIVCDEPVSALDVSIRAQIVNLLEDLQAERKISYLFIAHDLNLVEHISHDVAVMYLGRIVEHAPADELYLKPLHPYTRALLAANPVPDPERKRERILLGGDVPSPVNPPPGCHFAPRCPLADDKCRGQYPEMLEAAPGHRVACYKAGQKGA